MEITSPQNIYSPHNSERSQVLNTWAHSSLLKPLSQSLCNWSCLRILDVSTLCFIAAYGNPPLPAPDSPRVPILMGGEQHFEMKEVRDSRERGGAPQYFIAWSSKPFTENPLTNPEGTEVFFAGVLLCFTSVSFVSMLFG